MTKTFFIAIFYLLMPSEALAKSSNYQQLNYNASGSYKFQCKQSVAGVSWKENLTLDSEDIAYLKHFSERENVDMSFLISGMQSNCESAKSILCLAEQVSCESNHQTSSNQLNDLAQNVGFFKEIINGKETGRIIGNLREIDYNGGLEERVGAIFDTKTKKMQTALFIGKNCNKAVISMHHTVMPPTMPNSEYYNSNLRPEHSIIIRSAKNNWQFKEEGFKAAPKVTKFKFNLRDHKKRVDYWTDTLDHISIGNDVNIAYFDDAKVSKPACKVPIIMSNFEREFKAGNIKTTGFGNGKLKPALQCSMYARFAKTTGVPNSKNGKNLFLADNCQVTHVFLNSKNSVFAHNCPAHDRSSSGPIFCKIPVKGKKGKYIVKAMGHHVRPSRMIVNDYIYNKPGKYLGLRDANIGAAYPEDIIAEANTD